MLPQQRQMKDCMRRSPVSVRESLRVQVGVATLTKEGVAPGGLLGVQLQVCMYRASIVMSNFCLDVKVIKQIKEKTNFMMFCTDSKSET